MALFALGRDSTCEVVAVWKQNPFMELAIAPQRTDSRTLEFLTTGVIALSSQVIVDGDRDFLWFDSTLREVIQPKEQPDEAKEECDYSHKSVIEHV